MINKLTQKVLLAAACSFVLSLGPVSGLAAQGIVDDTTHAVKKGAGAVKKGVETGAEKTKEGAEAVGRETKELFTGEESKKSSDRMKPTETQGTGATSNKTEATAGNAEGKKLPRTAGELPLLGLIGAFALFSAGTLKAFAQYRK